ncbi:glucosaminidase domain-containing protein [Marinomonas sp. C2222]|uniref:Glucosaminidase domain-containing protein n=1 Tax=Marinomonas sargassi TaxID=2984494 RepID=A0ABT2YNH8_9GAMM|nr:glucosaminidase domain-containing protein [Marinomonas sargassi]MCV2401441.1 glucosaminidase domain-containing protein [Marinomonas sargassi]
MEKKILWVISLILVLILWIRVDSSIEESKVSKSAEQAEKSATETSEPQQAVEQLANKPKAQESKAENKTPVTKQPVNKPTNNASNGSIPDFAKIANIKERKETFFNFLTPFIKEKNTLVLQNRQRLMDLIESDEQLSPSDIQWISSLRKRSKLKVLDSYNKEHLSTLLVYIDIIPASLVLAQAANESAWGTSRFATQGNNFFGQWCFRKGCGLVPASRNSDANHEVRKFAGAKESVFAYINNLNSNGAYKKLRATRAMLRDENKEITGLDLTHGLIHYSEKGQVYVEEIEGLINYNKLWRFNHAQTLSEIQ